MRAEKPTDLQLIEMMVMVYRGLNRSSEAIDLYEVLFNANPTDDVEKNLLSAYLSSADFEKGNKLGLARYSATGKIKYGVYAVESNYIRATFDPTAKSSLMISGLLVTKMLVSKPEAQHLHRLSFQVNLLQGNLDKAIEILQGRPDILDNPVERSLVLCDIYENKGDLLAAMRASPEPLRANLSLETSQLCWNAYTKFMDLAFTVLGE
jgi:tetratricopeptide (TPR) repeat protein